MRFVVLSSAPVFHKKDGLAAYPPYVKEMDIWFSKVDGKILLAPDFHKTAITTIPFTDDDIDFRRLPYIEMTSIRNIFRSIVRVPNILYKIYSQFRKADHIHLRCPGNMGLLGCLVQIVFPKIPKTVKYAGNWDPNAKQAWSYRLQKRILSNTGLTKNCKVLVYGDWPNQTKNIISFFTASYFGDEKKPLTLRNYKKSLQVLFVGSLVKGKQPLKAIKLFQELLRQKPESKMYLFGEGAEKNLLEEYILHNKLTENVQLVGNVSAQTLKRAYQQSHFLILPSKSEGWPKVVAEAMFWGCLPISTPVSCVPWMLDNGKRGILLDEGFSWKQLLEDEEKLQEMSQNAVQWSQHYTLERFETEISKLLTSNVV